MSASRMLLALLVVTSFGCGEGVKETATPSKSFEHVSDAKAQSKAPALTRSVGDTTTTAQSQPEQPDTVESRSDQVETAVAEPILTGSQLCIKFRCLVCHNLGGEGRRFGSSLDNLKARYDAEKLAAFLRQPPYRSMPRFSGTEEELKPLVEFLLK